MLDNESFEVLRKAERADNQKSLAEELGYSVGKVNYILKALIEKGFIKIENFANSKNKKQYKYLLTPQGIKEKIAITEKFIERKKREYEELQNELEITKNQSKNLDIK
ncbi:MAG: MarR family EPS-associated transcriptional regulator [Campylobacteraceae bacterium]